MKDYFPYSIRLLAMLVCVGLLSFLMHCIDPVDIDIPEQAPLLVVDGLITDKPGPYFVRLSESSQLNEFQVNPVAGAQLVIEEEGGGSASLTEIEPGYYLTDSLDIRGEVGKRYRLVVSFGADRNYQSDWIQLKAAPPIGDIYYEFGFLSNERIPVQGANLFLDTRDPENKTRFYRWEYEETWIHIAPFASGLLFLGNGETEQGPAFPLCYNSARSNNIFIASSVSNTEDVISKFPIKTVSGFGSELRYRYSFLAKQYAMDESEFLFWKSVQEANENTGTLFDRQPQSTTGNMIRLENNDEPVLGFFSVSGYAEKRIFIERQDLPLEAVIGEQYIQTCFIGSDTFFPPLETERDVFNAINGGFVFFNFYRNPDIAGWIVSTKGCTDCREAGGTIEKPDFW